MPSSAGGQTPSVLEQLLEIMTNKDLYTKQMADLTQKKIEADKAVEALAQVQSELAQAKAKLDADKETLAERDADVSAREQAASVVEERWEKWKQLLPQIAELVK